MPRHTCRHLSPPHPLRQRQQLQHHHHLVNILHVHKVLIKIMVQYLWRRHAFHNLSTYHYNSTNIDANNQNLITMRNAHCLLWNILLSLLDHHYPLQQNFQQTLLFLLLLIMLMWLLSIIIIVVVKILNTTFTILRRTNKNKLRIVRRNDFLFRNSSTNLFLQHCHGM